MQTIVIMLRKMLLLNPSSHIRIARKWRNWTSAEETVCLHWCLSSCACIDFASSVPTERREGRKAPTHKIRNAESYKLPICAKSNTLNRIFPFTSAQTLSCNGAFEKTEQGYQEGGPHGLSHVFHVSNLKRPVEWERVSSCCGLHFTKHF